MRERLTASSRPGQRRASAPRLGFRIVLVILAVGALAATGATELSPSLASAGGRFVVQEGPVVNFLNPPDGAEATPASRVSVAARITDADGVAAAEMFWQKTGNTLPCPGSGSDWQCSIQGDTYTWVLELSSEEGVRTYHVRARDSRGNRTVTPDRTIRITSQPTGISIALLSPTSGSTVQPGTDIVFAADVRGTASPVRSVRVRPADEAVSYTLSPDPARPNVWQLSAAVGPQAPAGEHTFVIEASSESGTTAVAGPFRLIIQGVAGPGNFPVFRYQTAALDDARAGQILERGQLLLTTNDGSYDVSCPLMPPLALSGHVQPFTFTDGNIDTSAELASILNRPGGGAYVVNEINYCGGPPSPGFTILGCASGGTPIVVVRRSSLQVEGILWTHEYGHVKGLGHRDEAGNVMHSVIDTDHTMVRDFQCRNYQQPALAGGQQGPQPAGQQDQPVPILEFIRRQFIHGVPYDEAARYTSADVPLLLTQLERPAEGVYLPTVVGTLGVIGDPRAVQPLIAFVERGTGRISDELYGAKKAALLALGHITNKSPSPQAVDYLTRGLDPAHWNSVLRWQLPYDAPAGTRNWQMVKASAWGLGVSGKPEGARPLQSALERFRAERAASPPDLPDLIQDAMNTNATVRRIGLRAFYTRQF